jgi:hypothetical protein
VKLIKRLIKPVLNQVSWGVQWDRQLNLELSFGDPVIRIREPYTPKRKSKVVRDSASRRLVRVKGKWWLWIFCATWKLRVNSKISASSASATKQKIIALNWLDGQRLTDVKINRKNGTTVFEFDLGARLRVERLEYDDSDIWTLYFPNGMVLSVVGNGTYVYQRGSTAPSKLIPIPLKFA